MNGRFTRRRLAGSLAAVTLAACLLTGCTASPDAGAASCGSANNQATMLSVGASTKQIPANATLFQAIQTAADGNPRLELAGLMGSYLESGWDNTATNGIAYGPWQILMPGSVHPDITIAQAEDPAYATAYWFPHYRAALNYLDPAEWANPEKAAEKVAYKAEVTGPYHEAQGWAKVDLAYRSAITVMASLGTANPDFTAGAAATAQNQTTPDLQLAAQNCSAYAEVGTGLGAKALAAAQSQLGVPYVFGAERPKSATDIGAFDCSGLVIWALKQVGVTGLEHNAASQWHAMKNFRVGINQAQPGFPIYFVTDGSPNDPGHVGIVVDPVKKIMINAPQEGVPVEYDSYANSTDIVGIVNPYAWAASKNK